MSLSPNQDANNCTKIFEGSSMNESIKILNRSVLCVDQLTSEWFIVDLILISISYNIHMFLIRYSYARFQKLSI